MARDRVTQSEENVSDDSQDNQVTSEYGSTSKPVRKSGRSAAQKAKDRIMALEEDEDDCC